MPIQSPAVKLSACALALLAAVVPGAVVPGAAASAANAAAACLKVTANIAVPGNDEEYPVATAVDPVTGTLYVADADDAYQKTVIYVVNAKTNAVETTIAVNGQVFNLTVNTQTDTLYATAWQSGGALITIDGQTNTVTNTVDFGYSHELLSPALDQKTQRMYVANRIGNSVVKFNLLVFDGPDYDKKAKTISTGRYGDSVVVDPRTNRVYVAVFASNVTELLVIGGQSGQVIDTIDAPTASYADHLAIDTATNTIYFVPFDEGAGITVVDGTSDAVTGEFTVPGSTGVQDLAVDPAAGRLYVAYDGSVALLNQQTDHVVASADVGIGPQALAIDTRTRDLYAIIGNASRPTATTVVALHDSCTL